MNEPRPRASRGWFSHPLLSLVIAGVWLLLQQSVRLPDLLAAAFIAVLVPRLVHGLLGGAVRPRGIVTIGRFLLIVLWDIVVSNLVVARIVLTPGRVPRPAWVPVALELHDQMATTLLAAVITTTPGTVSCVIDEEGRVIYVHALDCDDPAALAAQIKERYERPLKEIFEWHQA